MIVTRIGNPSRTGSRAVYAKGDSGRSQRVATLTDASLAALGIAPGTAWTSTLADQAERAALVFRIKRDAYRVVGRSAVSRQRLIDRLKRKGHDPQAAADVADDLVARGLIDDEAFAINAAIAMSTRAGKRLVEAKLRARGIDQKTATRAAGKAAGERDGQADAMRLARARLKRMSDKVEPEARRRRLYGLLARRGYDPDVCRSVVETLLRPARAD